MNIIDTIERNYSTLTKTEKKMADFILQDQDGLIINMTIQELSRQLRLGEASVIRFCRKMGFEGFQTLKLSIAMENAKKPEKSGTDREVSERLVKIFHTVKNTDGIVDRKVLEKAVDLLSESPMVYFYGMGSSGAVVEIADIRFVRMGGMSKALRDSHSQTAQSAIMNEKDVIVAVSVSGTTQDLYQTLKIAKDNGCRIIAITNHENSRIARLADYVLLSHAPENPMTGGSFESVISQLYVLDLLFLQYAARNEEKVDIYLEKAAIAISQKLES